MYSQWSCKIFYLQSILSDSNKKQYKEGVSGYRQWSELSHADEWLVFPKNIGKRLCIDETAISNGELYTIVSNPEARGGKGSLVALVKGVKTQDVIDTLKLIPENLRSMVKEVTMDLSNSMNLIVRRCFPKASRTIDRFHVQKLAYDALQKIRIARKHSDKYIFYTLRFDCSFAAANTIKPQLL